MATDFILEIDGVEGESKIKGHEKKIEIQSWGIAMSNSGSSNTGGGGGSGKVHFQDIHFSKSVDSASNKLQLHCAGGKHIKKAILFIRKQGKDNKPQEFIKVTMEDLLISSYSLTPSGDTPQEQFTVNFAKYKFEYAPQKADGSLEAYKPFSWDVKANTGT